MGACLIEDLPNILEPLIYTGTNVGLHVNAHYCLVLTEVCMQQFVKTPQYQISVQQFLGY